MRQPQGLTAASCDPDEGSDPDSAIAKCAYSIQDPLVSVIDPEGNETSSLDPEMQLRD